MFGAHCYCCNVIRSRTSASSSKLNVLALSRRVTGERWSRRIRVRASMRPGMIALLTLMLVGPVSAVPALRADSDVATAGFYRLTWDAGLESAAYELQEAKRADFADARSLYRGPDLATVLSGKSNGDYYYRVRVVDAERSSAWSEPVHVEVRSHSLPRALTFLVLGALVFLATVLLIVRGEARAR